MSSGDHERSARSLTDSPVYWVYLFCTAGLVALFLAEGKFAARQAQIERKAQGRQRAVQNLAGRELVTVLSDEEHTHISLRPLYYVLGAVLTLAWAHLIVRQWRRQRSVANLTVSSSNPVVHPP